MGCFPGFLIGGLTPVWSSFGQNQALLQATYWVVGWAKLLFFLSSHLPPEMFPFPMTI